jgi:hypothetical protein
MSKFLHFTSKAVQLSQNAVDDRGRVAARKQGGGFADHTVVSLHCLRVYLEKPYRKTLDLLSEISYILRDIRLEPGELPHHSTLVKWFSGIKTPFGAGAQARVTLRLPRHSSTVKTPANTTTIERITAARCSK